MSSLPKLAPDARALFKRALDAKRSAGKVTRAEFISEILDEQSISERPEPEASPAGADSLGLRDTVAQFFGKSPVTFSLEAKLIIEQAMNQVIKEGRDAVTVDDLRVAAQSPTT